MRILHVSDSYLPRLGGIEVHLHDLVRCQRTHGHDARIVTIAAPSDDVVDDPWIYRVDATTGPLAGMLRADAVLRQLVRDLDPDVVHVHVSVLSPFATIAARLSSRAGLPTVVTVHSMWSRLGPLPLVARMLLGLRAWPIVWTAVSDRAAEPLRAALGGSVPVQVLPNAVDPAAWRPASGPGPVPGVPTVISVMRMTRTKRTLPLGRILHEVRLRVPPDQPLRAVVVGEGPQARALERYLRRHRMDDWVELPGRLDRTAIRRQLAEGTLFLAPAALESFGIAALEARTAGLPVVASARSGVGEFVTHGREGLLGASDGDLAVQVVRLLTDERLRSRIARHNWTVPPLHDWVRACARTDQLYLEAGTSRSGVTLAPTTARVA